MAWHTVDRYIPMKSPVPTYARGAKKRPRVFKMGELDGFYVDTELDRAVHITFEENDVIMIDVYNAAQAAYNDTGEAISIIEVNLRTGRANFFTEGR